MGHDHDDVVHEVRSATLSPLSAGFTDHSSLVIGDWSLVTAHRSPVPDSTWAADAWFEELGREDRAGGYSSGGDRRRTDDERPVASAGMDLVRVLAHEFGPLLGWGDLDADASGHPANQG